MKKPAECSEEFLNLIKEWQTLEDKTIASAEDLRRRFYGEEKYSGNSMQKH